MYLAQDIIAFVLLMALAILISRVNWKKETEDLSNLFKSKKEVKQNHLQRRYSGISLFYRNFNNLSTNQGFNTKTIREGAKQTLPPTKSPVPYRNLSKSPIKQYYN